MRQMVGPKNAEHDARLEIKRLREPAVRNYQARHGTFISDGNSEISSHVWREIGFLICLRHLIRTAAVANLKFVQNKTCFS